VDAFLPLATYQHNIRAFLDGIKSVPVAPDFAEVLVPGEPEYRSRRQRLANGIPLPETIHDQLAEWAVKLGVPMEESIVETSDRARYAQRI
jgi:LDH2 family malate/lactate/ureidoglycolate dehydrogenase